MATTPIPQVTNPQQGGWYWNPTLSKSQQFWNGNWFDTPQQPKGDAGTASTLPSTGSGQQDYFSQAMATLQPITQAEVAPLEKQQQLIPQIYDVTKQQIGQERTAALGQQRATAATRGITSTSGVEQSQEANIAQGYASKLAMLPVQEAQSLLDVASQIATIQGQGIKEALTYASDLAKLASENAYREAQIELSKGRNEIAASRLQEMTDYHKASLALKQESSGSGKPSYIDTQAQLLAQEISQGKFKSVQEAMTAHPELSANTVFSIWTTQKGTTQLPTGFTQSGANIVAQPGTPGGGGFNLGSLPIIGGPLQQAGNTLGGLLGGLKTLIPGQ